ncbi:MAG: PAS domain S-box protein [Chloroflexota bacterium]|nr:PAS domain S-box protein [Chloroflexota bacterium]
MRNGIATAGKYSKHHVKFDGHRRLIEEAISGISTRFVNVCTIDKAIQDSLADLCMLTGATHAHLLIADTANLTFNNTHEWHTRGESSHTTNWHNIPFQVFSWQLSKLRKGNVVFVKNVSKMPASAKKEKAFMDERGITSFLALPLTTHNKFTGFIGLDNIELVQNWSKEEIELLGISSHTIGNVLEYKETQSPLYDSDKVGSNPIRASTDGIIMVRNDTVIFANHTMHEMLDYEEPELIGISLYRLLPSNHKGNENVDYYTLMQGECTHPSFEIQLVKKSGDTLWVTVTQNIVEYNDTQTMLGFVKDITSSKLMEQPHGYNDHEYTSLLESMPCGIVELQEGIAIHANHRFCDMFSLNKNHVIGNDLHQLFTGPLKDTLSVTSEDIKLIFIDDISANSTTKVQSHTYEVPFTINPHTTIWTEVNTNYLTHNKAPTRVVLFHDITSRKQVESELQAAQDNLRNVIYNIRDIYFQTDVKGTVLLMSSPALQFFQCDTVDEVIGKNMNETLLYPDDLTKRFADFISHSAACNDIYTETSELTLATKSGEILTMEIMISSLKDSSGQLVGVEGIAKDVTEWKKVEIQRERLVKDLEVSNTKLVKSNQELQDFVHIASHDLREPLRKISAFGEVLTDSLQGKLTKDEKENLNFMIDGATRMQAMVDALLVYSRVTTRVVPLETVDLNRVVDDLTQLELASQLADTHGTLDIPQPLPKVLADDAQMHQLLHNLIGNGLKYHKRDCPPRVTIHADSTSDQMVKIMVEDNGIGISNEHFDEIFTMFKRLHSIREYEGTGIGLAVCKRIVEHHGGQIGVESTPGTGSSFWFTIPAA